MSQRYLPLPTPSNIVQFRPKERDRAAYEEARIRYLQSIISNQSLPFDARMNALVQVAMMDRKRA